VSEILGFHQATKHSPRSVAMSLHRLDWSNKPLPFKIYRGLESIEPPAPFAHPDPVASRYHTWFDANIRIGDRNGSSAGSN
jgi:hypothetical protein